MVDARFRAAGESRRVRWANDSGWTREIVRVPDRDNWHWRLSIAESDSPAQFSSLPGIDRELILLRGAGLALNFADGATELLTERYDHVRFAGDRPLSGSPLAGPTEQLNLMWRRHRVRADRLHVVSDDDERLLRNRSGIARARASDEPLETLELETAIARNVRTLRTARGMSIADVAVKVGISRGMLSKIENAQTSCSLSSLAALARGLNVPVTSLLRGADSERPASFVKAGQGTPIVRNGSQAGHDYEMLGTLRGEHKRLECLLVTLTAKSETYPLFQHAGTEFIYMLEGRMDYGHGPATYALSPGDSLQLDGEAAHGPVNLTEFPIRFLSVIAFPDNTI